MRKSFNIVKGNHVPCLDGIEEGYSVKKNTDSYQININVSAENIDIVFRRLCAKVRNPGFLLLEHGTNGKIEEQLRKSKSDPFHKDVYYLDGLDLDSFFQVYDQYKDLFIHDGEINYGFGSHIGMDEIYVGPYKVFTIFTDGNEKYLKVLSDLGFARVEQLKTVCQNFSESSPGARMTIEHNGLDIYEMVEQLKKRGLYLGERREE